MNEISGSYGTLPWPGGYGTVLALCLLLLVVVLLFWKSRRPGVKEEFLKSYGHTGHDRGEIPSLSVYEAALVVRDIHRLALVLTASLVKKGAVEVAGTPAVLLKKTEKPCEPLNEVESEFLEVIDSGGRINHARFNGFVNSLARGLAHRIWLADKVLIRHFLEDKIELIAEAAGERPLSFPDSLWPLLHGDAIDWNAYHAGLSPAETSAEGTANDDLPSLLYRELAISSLLPLSLLECTLSTIRSHWMDRHPLLPPALLDNLHGAIDALSTFSSTYLDIYRQSVAEPYLQSLASMKVSDPSSGPDAFMEARPRWKNYWEEKVRDLVSLTEEWEHLLVAHEDRVDYFQGSADVNPVLKDREESIVLRREILSREVFQLRAAREGYPSILARGLNWKEVRAIGTRLQEKEKALAATTLELDSLRREWEKERRERLRSDPSLLREWCRLLVDCAQVRMEKGFVESHQDSLVTSCVHHECLEKGAIAGSSEGNEALCAAMREGEKVLDALGLLEIRLYERREMPVSRVQEGEGGALSETLSRVEEILRELRCCIDGFSYGEERVLLERMEQCHVLLERLDDCIEPLQDKDPGKPDAQSPKEPS